MTSILLQTKVGGSPMGSMVVWCVVIVAIITVGLVVVSRVKKRLQGDDAEGASSGFTLSDLRAMRDAGEMSAEEFDKARGMVIDAAKRAAARDAARQAAAAAGGAKAPLIDPAAYKDDADDGGA